MLNICRCGWYAFNVVPLFLYAIEILINIYLYVNIIKYDIVVSLRTLNRIIIECLRGQADQLHFL